MKRYELFAMIFYALDAYYEEDVPEEINNFLSDMCPFTFADEGSADPVIYKDYCEFMGNKEILLENSFSLAKEYVFQIKDLDLKEAFSDLTEEFWIQGCKEFSVREDKKNFGWNSKE